MNKTRRIGSLTHLFVGAIKNLRPLNQRVNEPVSQFLFILHPSAFILAFNCLAKRRGFTVSFKVKQSGCKFRREMLFCLEEVRRPRRNYFRQFPAD
jgi:hypothetical protein